MPEGKRSACSGRCRAELSRERKARAEALRIGNVVTRLLFAEGSVRRLEVQAAAVREELEALRRVVESRGEGTLS